MQQHPVPQNIMGVEFKLVGSMTLKQFGFLAAPGVVGFVIFSLPIPAFIKWPFILLLGLIGVSFAFIPINDITLDRWILVFLRTIYSPTRRIWKKELQHLEFLEDYFSSQRQADTYSVD